MPGNGNDEIRIAPADLYDRLGGLGERVEGLRREIAEIRNEYERLGRHPEELAVDNLGAPIDPAAAAHVTADYLGGVYAGIHAAHADLDHLRSRYASRLKLTDQAAEDLDRRTARRNRPERSR